MDGRVENSVFLSVKNNSSRSNLANTENKRQYLLISTKESGKVAFYTRVANILRSRSKENLWNISFPYSAFFLSVFSSFIIDSFSSSSANTRVSVRRWWWCQSFCSRIMPMYSIYYHNLSFFFSLLTNVVFVCAFIFPHLLLFNFFSSFSFSFVFFPFLCYFLFLLCAWPKAILRKIFKLITTSNVTHLVRSCSFCSSSADCLRWSRNYCLSSHWFPIHQRWWFISKTYIHIYLFSCMKGTNLCGTITNHGKNLHLRQWISRWKIRADAYYWWSF